MKEKDDFFSPDHERLLNIATWAKYLAWIVLITTIAYTGIITLGNYVLELQKVGVAPGPDLNVSDFLSPFKGNIPFLIKLIAGLVYGILRSFVYYCVLKGISLGLNMIVETDINYREKMSMEGDNE